MKPAAFILDFDGTILDTEWSQYETVREEFARHGHHYDLDHFRGIVGTAHFAHWSDVLQELTGPLENIDEVLARRSQAHLDLIAASEIRPGVEAFIELGEVNGLGLGVASSSPIDWVSRHLSDRGLFDRFHAVATRDRVERAKPWPDVYLLAALELEVDPSTVIAIEDSPHGVAAAKDAGMVCVAVPNPITAGGDFGAADLVLESLQSFPAADFGF